MSDRPAATTALALALLALGVWAGWLRAVDETAFFAVQQWRVAWLDAWMYAIAFLGDWRWAVGVGAILSAWWVAHRRPVALPVFWGAWGAGLAVQTVLRVLVGQLRPDVVELPADAHLLARVDLAGFTSGHAFRSAFLYGWLALAARRAGPWGTTAAIGLLGVILAIGVGRVYLARHWPTDVVGAWGLAWLTLHLIRSWRVPVARVVPTP